MNKTEAKQFLTELYQNIVVDLNVEKLPYYFTEEYIQVTDGVKTNFSEFTQHIITLKKLVEKIVVSPFYDFLFDEELQTATLRYTVDVTKKTGEKGQVEMIAIFELKEGKIIRCHELSRPVNNDASFKDIASVNVM